MASHGRLLRLVATVLVVVLAAGLATPAQAEADVLTTLAIVSLVVAGVVIVVYLIVANVKGSRMQTQAAPALVACVESDASPRDCWPMAGPVPSVALPPPEPQS
ncbi:MAG: hypothetical protein HYV93_25320 [Candidatus Rokubacteria bacterium]|nr:hypothetical protein [Candidatus Rokubacteria bacterium]